MTDPAAGQGPRERAYRRLLACYPPEHRSAHEEEMLGVLMSSARDGLARPALREAANLVSGAARIRLRTGLTDPADPRGRDTLSAISVILPLILLAEAASSSAFGWLYVPPGVIFPLPGMVQLVAQGQLILVILILLRLRQTAALFAAIMLVWWVWIAAGAWASAAPLAIFYLVFYGLEISALLASPGPRRGLQILTGRRLAVLATAGLAAGAVAAAAEFPGSALLPVTLAAIAALAVISAGMILASAASRRIFIVVAIPAASLTVEMTAQRSFPGPGPVLLFLAYLVPLGAASLAALAVRHSRSHPVPPGSSGRHP